MLHISTICLLHKHLLDEIAAKNYAIYSIYNVTTDIEEKSPTCILGPWKYKNSETVIITYLLNETIQNIQP